MSSLDKMLGWFPHTHRLAMKILNRAVLGAYWMASALLLSGFVLCNFGAQADVHVPYPKIGGWSLEYLEVGKWSGCRAAAQFPDQTFFQMALLQSGTDKGWVIFISNPKWNAWIGQRKQLRLQLVTTRADKPWLVTFSTFGDSKMLSFTDASVEFMNSVADARSMEIMDENKQQLLTSVDLKDSAAAIVAIVNCVSQHPPGSGPSPEPETTISAISGTGFFVAAKRVVTNNHVVSGCTKDIQVQYPNGRAYTATVSGQDATNDLALLNTDMDNLSTAAFHPRPRVGDQVASYGFPLSRYLSSDGNFTLGYVTALTGPKDDTRFLQMSTPIQPGNSGGALLDMSGSVVGVVVAQFAIPNQNVNFAIQPSIVTNFLEVKGVIAKYTSSTDPQRPPSEVSDIAKKFTIHIYCQGISPKTATGSARPLVLSPSDVADFSSKF
jgi:serine protease Do